MSLATYLGWRAKLAAKVGLARLPVSYSTWRRIGVFRHGAMTSPEYATRVFERHARRVRTDLDLSGVSVLEIGPGDSLFGAVLARAAGAESCVCIDSGDYINRDIDRYRRMAEFTAARGLGEVNLDGATSMDDVLDRCHATYLTQGLESLRSLPSASIDFTWSHATLEHVRRRDFADTAAQLSRVLEPGGVGSHRIDLRDHLGDGLNNLRFSDRIWESEFMANSGFYTNRLRYTELLDLFDTAGFKCEVVEVDRWGRLPTPRSRLAPPFRALGDEDLIVKGFDVLLYRALI